MKTIAWQTRSTLLYNSIKRKELDAKANGGNAYDFQAAMALTSFFKVVPDSASIYRNSDNPAAYWWRMKRYIPITDYRVMEPYPIVFGGNFSDSFNVAMIHHIDTQADNGSIKYRWFYNRLFKRLREFNKVVTVSKYWKEYLNNKGCDNVDIIYNSFSTDDYSYSIETISTFKQSLGFDLDLPLIYIGNASRNKGVHHVYEVIKNLGYQLVMTGAKNYATDIPVKFFNLSASDYRKLIASCDVVITMSGMMEGWNRVAHEAMLSKVPVIGSGTGGMRELLEGGKQHIASEYIELPKMIEECLSQKKQFGADGYRFVAEFNEEYFKETWKKVFL